MDDGIVVLFIFALWDQFFDAAWYILCRRSLRHSLSTNTGEVGRIGTALEGRNQKCVCYEACRVFCMGERGQAW